MSPSAVDAPGAGELRDLYDRYKSLALATGAALLLDSATDALAAKAAELLADARAAAFTLERSLQAQISACIDAASDLSGLLALAVTGAGDISEQDTDRVRASHSHLRREVWKVIPCEYVPCATAHQHAHPHGQ